MAAKSPVLTEAQMKEQYGKFFKKGHKMKFKLADVPESLHPLVPYARFWASEDGEYEELLSSSFALFYASGKGWWKNCEPPQQWNVSHSIPCRRRLTCLSNRRFWNLFKRWRV